MRLVYVSPVPWHSFSQRPHELVHHFHRTTGGEVFWIDPYPTRLPVPSDLFRLRHGGGGESGTPEWLTRVSPRALPVEPLPVLRAVNRLFWKDIRRAIACFSAGGKTALGIGKPSLFGLDLLDRLRFDVTFYDAMDDFPAFYDGISRCSMAAVEGGVVRRVDRVLASASCILERLRQEAGEAILIPNGCASERFPAPMDPERIARDGENSPPVLGYVGTIGKWFDWEFVFRLAAACPGATIRVIGPAYVLPPRALPRNVSLEAPLSHAQAIRTMASFDIGLIPFLDTRLTAGVDPIKYYEYRALGIPVISTAFGEMCCRRAEPGVWIVNSPTEDVLASTVRQARGYSASHDEVMAFRNENSWASRFASAGLFSGGTLCT